MTGLESTLISIMVPVASGACGVGVTYGLMKGSIRNLERGLSYLSRRVDRNEAKLDKRGVMIEDLERQCDQCHENFLDKIELVKQQVENNKNIVVDQLKRVEEYLQKLDRQNV